MIRFESCYTTGNFALQAKSLREKLELLPAKLRPIILDLMTTTPLIGLQAARGIAHGSCKENITARFLPAKIWKVAVRSKNRSHMGRIPSQIDASGLKTSSFY